MRKLYIYILLLIILSIIVNAERQVAGNNFNIANADFPSNVTEVISSGSDIMDVFSNRMRIQHVGSGSENSWFFDFTGSVVEGSLQNVTSINFTLNITTGSSPSSQLLIHMTNSTSAEGDDQTQCFSYTGCAFCCYNFSSAEFTDTIVWADYSANELLNIELRPNWTADTMQMIVDGVDKGTIGNRGGAQTGYPRRLMIIGKQGNAHTSFIDDIRVWTFEDVSPPPPLPPAISNTSIFTSEFNASDLTFGTDTFFNAFTFLFNTSEETNLTFLSSFNLVKLSGGATTNEIFGQILEDGNVLTTESLRTVTGTGDEGSTGFLPLMLNVSASAGGHSHNLTITLRRTGVGNVQINDIDFILIQFLSSDGNNIRVQDTKTQYTHSNNEFVRAFNWTIPERTAKVFILNKQLINASEELHTRYMFQNIDIGENSSVLDRHIFTNTQVGAISNLWIYNKNNTNFTILSQTNTGVVTVNTSIIDFDLFDSGNNTIQSFNTTNTSTTVTSNLTLGAGLHRLLSINKLLHSGDSSLLASTISFKSTTGSQTPIFIMNTSNITTNGCFSKKERFLSNNDDIGNVYFYTSCTNLTINSTYIFDLWVIVEAGESIDILDEYFAGFDTTELNITRAERNISITLITDLVNNTINFNDQNLEINYNFTVSEFNAFDIANCSLIFNGTIDETQVDRNDSTDYLFNVSLVDIESNLTFEVNCTNPEISTTSGIFNYRVDNINPIILTDFANTTTFQVFDSLVLRVNFTDVNLFAYNITFTDLSTQTVTENIFTENLTITFADNVTSRVVTDIGVFSIDLNVWDSHTSKTVRELGHEKKPYGYQLDNDIDIIGNITDMLFLLDTDRYKFKIKFGEDKRNHEITLKTTHTMTYIPKETGGYIGHFVYLPLNRWIDFECKNVDKLTVNTISSSEYDLNFRLNISDDEIECESIGDLNTNSQTLFFTVTAQAPQVNLTINLTGVENAIRSLGGDLFMIGMIIFVGLFFIIGIWIKQPLFWSFSGVGLMVIGVKFASDLQTNDTLFNLWTAIIFITFALLTFFLAVALHLKNVMAQKKVNDFYNI